MIKNKLIPVKVKKIIYFPPSKNYAIILNDPEINQQLPIIVGTFEAQAIALGIENITMPRPMTHDLITGILKKEKLAVEKIIITQLIEGTFYANILYKNQKNENFKIDSRPSDAIAIALRTGSQIFVAEQVMNVAGQKINIKDFETKLKTINNPANNIDILDQIFELQLQMQTAINTENYEQAAEFRDQIKSLETKSHN